MVRQAVGVLVGFSLALVLSTVALGLFWGGPAPRGALPVSLVAGLVCVLAGGLVAGAVGEERVLLLGSLVGIGIGGLVGLWPGAFPLRTVFLLVPLWRTAAVPLSAAAGLLGGWIAGRLIAPGGWLAGEDRPQHGGSA